MEIRKYTPKDRISVERIHYETGFIGKSMKKILDSKQMFSQDISYYFRNEPDNIFVAEENGEVLGYVLACENDNNHSEAVTALKNVFLNFSKYFFMTKKDKRFFRSRLMYITRAILGLNEDAKLKKPRNSGHIHINLLPEARGKGLGSKMLKTVFKHLKGKGVKVIHADSFDTHLNNNKSFWLKNGFREYSRIKTEIWKEYLPEEKISLECFYKKL